MNFLEDYKWNNPDTQIGLAFDWDKAAEIINHYISLYPKLIAYAGLINDWPHTFDVIFKNGQPAKAKYARLASMTDKPILVIYKYRNDNKPFVFTCNTLISTSRFYVFSRWNNKSLAILNNKKA